ncbi:MAG: hypothetical protein L0Y72_04650 [Gemmataceae bacterium]|nr:hypothetical protein [Gemmataceae bacterium]MCI0738310.1 hypothetical protein [Gemmataceae bacterium]
MSPKTRNDEFFVGWLQTPQGYVRFLKPMVLALVAIGGVVAGALAFFQRDPGNGHWDDTKIVTLRGVAITKPYAMLRVAGDNPGDAPRTFLLVEDGKFGALPRVSALVQGSEEGVRVEVRGTILHRDDRWMLAFEEGEQSLRILTQEEASWLPFLGWSSPKLLAESITLRGEVIDPKCYLGAMKPGGGKTHKACAMRCIAGGIPPMLVTRDAAKRETFYLLVTPEGAVANDAVYPFVGDQVELSGRAEQHDDVLVLKVSPENIRRR